jgi:hypothetical protein
LTKKENEHFNTTCDKKVTNEMYRFGFIRLFLLFRLPDEWVQHKDFKPEKVVKFDDLPAEAKRLINDFKFEAVKFRQEQATNKRKRAGAARSSSSETTPGSSPSSPVKQSGPSSDSFQT